MTGGPICSLNAPVGQWHTLRALESGTVILEMKDGAYEPISPADILSMSFRGVGCVSCYNANSCFLVFLFLFFVSLMTVKSFFSAVWQFCSYLFWPRWGGKSKKD